MNWAKNFEVPPGGLGRLKGTLDTIEREERQESRWAAGFAAAIAVALLLAWQPYAPAPQPAVKPQMEFVEVPVRQPGVRILWQM